MTASALSVRSPLTLGELTRRESKLRLGYIETLPVEDSPLRKVDRPTVHDLLSQSVQLLELTVVAACLMEAAERLEITTGTELSNYETELLAETKAMCGLDPLAIVAAHARDRDQVGPFDF